MRDGVVSVGVIKMGTSLEDVVGTAVVVVVVVCGIVTLVVLVFVAVVVDIGDFTVTGVGVPDVDEEDDLSTVVDSFSGDSPCVPPSVPSMGSSRCTCVELSVATPMAVGATNICESKLELAKEVGRVATDAEDMGISWVIVDSEDSSKTEASGGNEDLLVISVADGVTETGMPEELGNISGTNIVGKEGSFSVTIIVGSGFVSTTEDFSSETAELLEGEVDTSSVNAVTRGMEVCSFFKGV